MKRRTQQQNVTTWERDVIRLLLGVTRERESALGPSHAGTKNPGLLSLSSLPVWLCFVASGRKPFSRALFGEDMASIYIKMCAYKWNYNSIYYITETYMVNEHISQYTSKAIRKAAISLSFVIRIQGSRATPPAITLLRRWSTQAALEKTRGS